jgi:hypothetical protein
MKPAFRTATETNTRVRTSLSSVQNQQQRSSEQRIWTRTSASPPPTAPQRRSGWKPRAISAKKERSVSESAEMGRKGNQKRAGKNHIQYAVTHLLRQPPGETKPRVGEAPEAPAGCRGGAVAAVDGRARETKPRVGEAPEAPAGGRGGAVAAVDGRRLRVSARFRRPAWGFWRGVTVLGLLIAARCEQRSSRGQHVPDGRKRRWRVEVKTTTRAEQGGDWWCFADPVHRALACRFC